MRRGSRLWLLSFDQLNTCVTCSCVVYSWNHQTSSDLGGGYFWGQVGSYSGSGFVQDLALTMQESHGKLKQLFDNLWLDRATRAVFVDFTVYNANINLFCVIKYVAVITRQ